MRNNLFYNSIIGLIMESYLILAVSCLINFKYIHFRTYGEIIQSVSCFIAMATLVIFPFALTCYSRRKWSSFGGELIEERAASYLEGLNLDRGTEVLIYPFYFLLRRMLMAICVVVFRNSLLLQYLIMALSITFAFALHGYVNVHEEPKHAWFELFNEVSIMLVLYCIIGFIPLLEPKPRSVIGICCCAVICLHLFVNLLTILFEALRQWLYNIKLWLAKRRLAKQRKAKRVLM